MRYTQRVATTILALLLTGSLVSAQAASKSDLAKEKRWEEQIVPGLIVGDAVKLKADGVTFLGLYAESGTDTTKGAVIVLHGIGVHPDWADVIHPLRTELPDDGWATLSLQMPILGNDATDKDYPPLMPEVPGRIQAGVDFLKAKGFNNIVLAAHSLGTSMAAYYLVTDPDPAIKAFVIISGGPGVPGDARMDTLANFQRIHGLKMFDIHGSDDMKLVLESAAKRSQLAQKEHLPDYQAVEIRGANHFYSNNTADLVDTVETWLDSQMVSKP